MAMAASTPPTSAIKKPTPVTYNVYSDCFPKKSGFSMISEITIVGAGNRKLLMPKMRTDISQTTTRTARTTMIVRVCSVLRQRLFCFEKPHRREEMTDVLDIFSEFLSLTNAEWTRPGDIDRNDFGDAAGISRHHHDAVAQIDGFIDTVRDEDDRLARLVPEP